MNIENGITENLLNISASLPEGYPIATYRKNIHTNYVHMDRQFNNQDFYIKKIRADDSYDGAEDDSHKITICEKQFIPIAEFAKKFSKSEIAEQEQQVADDEEYDELLDAFVKNRFYEAYEKYSFNRARNIWDKI